MFPSFLFKSVFTSKHFLSGHNSKKKAAVRSLKNIEIFLEASTHKKMSAAHFLSEAVAH